MTDADTERLVLIDYYWQLSSVDDACKKRLAELVREAGFSDWTAAMNALEPIRRKKRIAIEVLKSKHQRKEKGLWR